MAVRAVVASRTLARPRQVDARIIAAVFLGLAGPIGNLGLLGVLAPAEHEVVQAARDLPAGAILGASDLVRARVQVPDDVLAGVIPGDQARQLVGQRLVERVRAHDLLGRARLAGPGQALAPGELQVELSLRPESAVVDALQPGDPVTVLASLPPGRADANGRTGTRVVLPRARVAGVRLAATSSGSRGGLAAVLLTISQEDAVALADAQASGTIVRRYVVDGEGVVAIANSPGTRPSNVLRLLVIQGVDERHQPSHSEWVRAQAPGKRAEDEPETTGVAGAPPPAPIRAAPLPPERNPVRACLARLAPSSRRSRQRAVERIAWLLSDGRAGAASPDRAAPGPAHAAALHARLVDRYARSTVTDHLSAPRRVFGECRRLGLLDRATSHGVARVASLPRARAGQAPALLSRRQSPGWRGPLRHGSRQEPPPSGRAACRAEAGSLPVDVWVCCAMRNRLDRPPGP